MDFARNYVARLFGGDSTVLNFQLLKNQLVLSWTNAGFNLQTAPAVTGPFTNLPAATSPYTNSLTARNNSSGWRRRSCNVRWYGQPTPPRSLAIHHHQPY